MERMGKNPPSCELHKRGHGGSHCSAALSGDTCGAGSAINDIATTTANSTSHQVQPQQQHHNGNIECNSNKEDNSYCNNSKNNINNRLAFAQLDLDRILLSRHQSPSFHVMMFLRHALGWKCTAQSTSLAVYQKYCKQLDQAARVIQHFFLCFPLFEDVQRIGAKK